MADTTTTAPDKHDHHEHMMMHRRARSLKSAKEELTTVKDEAQKIVEKKDIHVHNTHEWLHKLHRASKKLLRDHETELDNAEQSSAWVNDALDAVYDADKQAVAIAKAIVAASGHRVAKDADFDKVVNDVKGLEASVDKALGLFPATEK